MDFPELNMSTRPEVEGFFDPLSNTISYLVKDPDSKACAIVDSVLEMDYAAGRITYESADKLISEIQARGLKLEWIIETHVHADHPGKSGSGRGSRKYRIRLARFSMKERNFSATARSSTPCSKMETAIALAG